MDIQQKHDTIVAGIKDYFQTNGFSKAVIGLSGGIDSSLAAALTVEAIGKKNVTGILMPEVGLSSKENLNHAKELAEHIGIKHITVPINNFLIS